MAKKKAARSSLRKQGFPALLGEVKLRIQSAQIRAIVAVNTELVRLYWDIGRLIDQRQHAEGWGASVIPRLSAELRNELPDLTGFSERNIDRMIAFSRAYPDPAAFSPPAVAKLLNRPISPQAAAKLPSAPISPPPVAKLEKSKKVPPPVAQSTENSLLWSIPWVHHTVIVEKIKDPNDRLWYMEQTLANGWSRNVLTAMIDSAAHRRAGKAVTNFDRLLPAPQSELAQQTLKDPYIFDFLTLTESFQERELEAALLEHLAKFMLELGQGFAFLGRQFRLDVGGEDHHLDLLFYHYRLRAFVVIDLKRGSFKPEYAGKLNFYCNVINDQLRGPDDQPTIGLILCQSKNNVIAEYALAGIDKPIGVSSYELTRSLPSDFKSVLPTVEQIEAEIASLEKRPSKRNNSPRKNNPPKQKKPRKSTKPVKKRTQRPK